MVLESLTASLPGWEIVLFIILVCLFLLIGGITTFIILSRLRWPFKYVVLENIAGTGYAISRRGRARTIGFGDGGEEIFLLKAVKKYRIGYGKRIGPRQIGWAIGDDGLWYQFSFGDLNKTLREIGVLPSSVNVRLGMSSVRKGLDKRYENQDWFSKFGPVVYIGMFLMILLLFAGIFWYAMNKQVQVAQLNAESINSTRATQEATQKTLSTLDSILSRLNLNPPNQNNIVGGSGLTPT